MWNITVTVGKVEYLGVLERQLYSLANRVKVKRVKGQDREVPIARINLGNALFIIIGYHLCTCCGRILDEAVAGSKLKRLLA